MSHYLRKRFHGPSLALANEQTETTINADAPAQGLGAITLGNAGYVVVDMKLSKSIIRKKKLAFEVFIEATNLSDADYTEQSDIPMPGRWIKSGARIEF